MEKDLKNLHNNIDSELPSLMEEEALMEELGLKDPGLLKDLWVKFRLFFGF